MKKWKITKREKDKIQKYIAFFVFRLSPAIITFVSTIGAILNINWTKILIAILGATTIFVGEVSGITRDDKENKDD